jgi:hypothetical protein
VDWADQILSDMEERGFTKEEQYHCLKARSYTLKGMPEEALAQVRRCEAGGLVKLRTFVPALAGFAVKGNNGLLVLVYC